ncbi:MULTISPECIES: adenylate/guanylate cyclase domain-containing protein [unclassified Bradyrhizobium]|uniref:ATP-binding protein n=1 Tax=unclassified Bradyrhizobium TaxID=2631580 RepID=UPI001FF45A2A|nr:MULTISPECIES: adenylate/guanylate cyclase domain-containing protein [unclassified Bradyrhizobium]MCJ9700759.1 AAA family ATPase [Bradyrhizobium sp. SHOUNA76]MCJ9729300.1 AAA family ATPase [Bradyrhizobium sp. PRIMUS42]
MDDPHDRATERRQLTVLFCDVVDSTGLSERCDTEDLREILLEFQAISSQCIANAGGSVVNYIGDGIRAEFGYPLASENEAESAVRCGLLLLRAIRELSERAIAAIREPLRVRIGVHTGVAVIGRAGPGHVHDATEIVGDTPNIAFRLLEMGEPGSLVISGETKRLLRGRFALQPLGMRSLKGLSRKVEVFLVAGETSEDGVGHRARHRNASRLVGRVTELGQLLQAWELAKTGQGRTVEITGEPGIGKSRLALELIERAALPDDLILAIQASGPHQNTPLYPIIRALEQRIGIGRDDDAEVNLARLRDFMAATSGGDEEQLTLIGQMLGLPVPAASGPTTIPDAHEQRRKTRDAAVRLLISLTRGEASLILVEDFHWTDPSTIEIVERIAGQIGGTRNLLVVTSRASVIGNVSPMILRIVLQRLDDEHCRDLAGSVVRDKQLPSQLLQQIVARSDGVPLFVEELAAAALETGQVDPGVRRAGASGPSEVPSALYDSLMLRLERLGNAKAVAQLASVIGRSFSHRLLAAVAGELHDALDPALERLRASGLIGLERDDDEKVYSFKHVLVRDVAYYSLLKRQRRELHDRVAEEIELHLPEVATTEPGYLAQHLSEAGRTSRAAQMWLRAAQQAAERSANLEAIAELNMALEEIRRLPAGLERDNLELNAQIALIGPTIAVQGFGADAVADVSSRAIELCRALDNDPRIFPALYARWSYLRVASNVREAGTLARDFLTLAEQKGTRADRMVGHRLLGTSLLDGETEQACVHLDRAAKLYDAAADRATAVIYGTDVQITSLSNLCICCWLVGRVSEAIAHGQEALGHAQQLAHAHTLGYAYAHACMLHTLERDVQTVRALAQRTLDGAIRRELPLWVSVARTFLGWADLESGRLAEGIDVLEKQRDFLQTAHLVYWLPTYLCWLAEAYLRVDRMADARRCLDQARNVFGRGGNYWYEVECLRIEGRFASHAQINDTMLAEQNFELALALAHRRGQRGFGLRAAEGLASLLAVRGQTDRARTLLQQELQLFAGQPERGDRADAKRLLRDLEDRSRV